MNESVQEGLYLLILVGLAPLWVPMFVVRVAWKIACTLEQEL